MMNLEDRLDRPTLKVAVYRVSDQMPVLIVSNRGPISFINNREKPLEIRRNNGGLVTALTGLARQTDLIWLACTQNELETGLKENIIPMDNGANIRVEFINPTENTYNGYYNVIANPLLWFLQHSMWNMPLMPVIDRATWQAWDEGYVAVNQLFAERVASLLTEMRGRPLVMFQDYHLYLAPRFLRQLSQSENPPIISHFIHIPWPGPEDWGMLPPRMRQFILDGLCAVDLLGFQTREDALNFLRTCESCLPTAEINNSQGKVVYQNHTTYVRDFPISIDVDSLKEKAESPEVAALRNEILDMVQDHKLILRIDRIEPSKNIVRGFQAFAEMLEYHPEHRGKVVFLALLVPSRLGVDEYKEYLDALMAAAGRINVTYGNHEWEPVRLLVGDHYDRAVAALQVYDVLLVNAIADGMNLVAKEGPIVNRKDGVLILSDRAGAWEQLEPGATIISPCDISATGEALHEGLVMSPEIRRTRADRLRTLIEKEDINAWLNVQLKTITELNL